MSNIPIAPYDVASDIRTLRRGNFLYLDGKKYRCPTLNEADYREHAEKIKGLLNICNNDCTGFRRLWHIITHTAGHGTPDA